MAIPKGLVDAIIQVESGGNPNAVNAQSGATGLGQFMPATAASLGIDPTDPAQARAGIEQYMGQLLQQTGGNLDKALARYGGFKTKDPSAYIAKVRALMPADSGKFYLGPDGQIYDEAGMQAYAAKMQPAAETPTPASANSTRRFKGPDGRIYTYDQVAAMSRPDQPPPENWGRRILQNVASVGTDTAHALTSLLNIPVTIGQASDKMLRKDFPNQSPLAKALVGDVNAPSIWDRAPTTSQLVADSNQFLYQPSNREERMVGAAGGAIPAAVASGGAIPALSILAGGPLGQFLAESKMVSDDPDVSRAVGNLAPLAATTAGGAALTGVGTVLGHFLNLPDWLHFLLDVGRHASAAGGKLLGSPPMSADDLIAKAAANPNVTGQFGASFTSPKIKALASVLLKTLPFGLTYTTQQEANQGNVPVNQ